MPNGDHKNWIRLCITVEGFYCRYGHWPTQVRLAAATIEEICHRSLTPRGVKMLEEKLRLVPTRDFVFVAEDERGKRFRYGDERTENFSPSMSAEEWLVSPPLNDDESWDYEADEGEQE